MVGAGGRQPAAAAVTALTSSTAVADVPTDVLLQLDQQHVTPDYTSVAIEKLLHSIWDTKVNDIMAAINHLGLV